MMRSPKLRTATYATVLCCTLALTCVGIPPSLRAAEPKPSNPAVGALTLNPTLSLVSVDWLDRANAVQARPRKDAERLADLLAEVRAAGLADRTDNLSAAQATPAFTRETAASIPFLPSIREDDASVLSPDARPTEFFTGYGSNPAAAPGSSRAAADAYLTDPAGRRASADFSGISYTATAPTAAAPSGYTPATRNLASTNFSTPAGGWSGSSSTRDLSVGATTLPVVPAMPYANTVLPARTGLGSGGFADLSATAPVQVHPAPLLIAPATNALPSGQTLYISELNGIISSATGNGGTVSTFKTISTTNALFGIGAFGNSLYVVEQNANAIDRIVISTGAVSTFASLGGTNSLPTALAIDTTGNIYVTLLTTSTIIKITTAGVVSTFATLPAGSQPQGLAFAPNGNLYSANSGLDSVSQITPAGVVTTLATFTGAAYPAGLYFGGLTVDKNGIIYVVDQETTSGALGNVYKVTTAGAISFFASVGANTQPIGLAFDANGVLYTANAANISQITPAGVVSVFATDNNGADYLVIVPEPATHLGGALLLGVVGLGLRRRFCRA